LHEKYHVFDLEQINDNCATILLHKKSHPL